MSKFVVIEGIDGSGTSTQARALARALEERGERVWSTWEPTDRPIGLLLRDFLGGRLTSAGDAARDRRLLAMLFAADRHDHLHRAGEGILDRRARGEQVVCARYLLSSLAYEGEGAEERDFVAMLNASFPLPDLTVYLDCPVAVALDRIHSTRSDIDLFENEDKLARVRHNYESLLRDYPGPSLQVDATRPAAAITAEIVARWAAL